MYTKTTKKQMTGVTIIILFSWSCIWTVVTVTTILLCYQMSLPELRSNHPFFSNIASIWNTLCTTRDCGSVDIFRNANYPCHKFLLKLFIIMLLSTLGTIDMASFCYFCVSLLYYNAELSCRFRILSKNIHYYINERVSPIAGVIYKVFGCSSLYLL